MSKTLSDCIHKYNLQITNKRIKEQRNMNKELNRKLEEIAFRLQRLTDDYHELLKEIDEMNAVNKNKNVIYEQHITHVDGYIRNNGYNIKSKIIEPCVCLNYVLRKNLIKGADILYEYPSMDNLEEIPILTKTKRIIETYIPSKNIVLVVEL